ncbi:MAG: hypothetical protein M1324_01420 [Patescibacteria group bacterium]|nr:hypothetical protein [Patescibacteria group bacterium]
MQGSPETSINNQQENGAANPDLLNAVPKKKFFNQSTKIAFLQILVLSFIYSITMSVLIEAGIFAVLTVPFSMIIIFLIHSLSFSLSRLIPWRFKHLFYPIIIFLILMIKPSLIGGNSRTSYFELNKISLDSTSLYGLILILVSSIIVLFLYILRLIKEESLLPQDEKRSGKLSMILLVPLLLILSIATYFSPQSQEVIKTINIMQYKSSELNRINIESLKSQLPPECSLGAISESDQVMTKYTSINCTFGDVTSDTGDVWPLSWKGTLEIGYLYTDSRLSGATTEYIETPTRPYDGYVPRFKDGPFSDTELSSGIVAKKDSADYPEGGLASINLYWMDGNHRFSLSGQFETKEGYNFKTETVGDYNLIEYTKKIALIITNEIKISN